MWGSTTMPCARHVKTGHGAIFQPQQLFPGFLFSHFTCFATIAKQSPLVHTDLAVPLGRRFESPGKRLDAPFFGYFLPKVPKPPLLVHGVNYRQHGTTSSIGQPTSPLPRHIPPLLGVT